MGMDKTYGVVRYQIRQGSPPGGEIKLYQKLRGRQQETTSLVMCISQTGNNKLKIYVDGLQMEQMSKFRYLGSLISEDGQRRFGEELR